MSRDRSNLLPFLAGLAVGAIAGILLAPGSGKETREKIKRKGREAKDALDDLVDNRHEVWNSAKEKASGAASSAKHGVDDLIDFILQEGRDLKDRIEHEADKHTKNRS